MCNFLSGFIVKADCGDIDILTFASQSDSHDDGKLILGLSDRTECRMFAKFEYVPQKDGTWKFGLDENVVPVWCDDDTIHVAKQKVEDLIVIRTVKEGYKFLKSGWWVIPDGVLVSRVFRDTTVCIMPGGGVYINDGTVTYNYGAVAGNDGTVTNNDGTVTRNYGTVTRNYGMVTDNYGKCTSYGNGIIVRDHTKGKDNER